MPRVRIGSALGLRGAGSFLSSPTGLLVLLLVAVLLFSLFLAWRDPLTFRIGIRNFVRGRRRTVVLLLGLLVGTAIISSSLVIGDTVASLSTHFAYIADGNVHEAVYATVNGSYAPLPYSFFQDMNTSLAKERYVQGVSPLFLSTGTLSGMDRTSGVPQTGMNLLGMDGNSSSALGEFTATNGTHLSGPRPGEVLLDPTAATDLDAVAGDHLQLSFGPFNRIDVTVLAVVQADARGGFQDNGEGNVFATLSDVGTLVGIPGVINYLAVTNTGGAQGGMAYTSTVLSEINSSLATTVAQFPSGSLPAGLAAHNILQSDVSSASSSASQLTTLFLVIGLFSIVSGSILVVGIFVLLSEERKGQMGVARAVGMTRRQLVKSYYFEGLAYSLGSAFLGTLLGVAVAYLLVDVMVNLVSLGSSTEAISQSFTVVPSSLLIAYCAGFLLTLLTMVITVSYVSRLNIVRAIRNLPEPPLNRRSYLRLALFGAIVLAIGLLLVREGLPTSMDISYVELGVSIALLGAAMVATAFVPRRFAFSGAAIGLVLFWGYLPIRTALFGSNHPGSIFVLFVEGIFLILAAILLYLFNADLVMRGISGLLNRNPKRVPVARVAFAYPYQKPFRTAMTLAIFAMVLFTIVAIASIGSGVNANLQEMVTSQSGGFTLAGYSETPIANLSGEVKNNSTLSSELSGVVSFYSAKGAVERNTSKGPESFGSQIAAAPVGVPAWENFYALNHYNFSSTWNHMSASAVWQSLETNSSVAVLSGDYSVSSDFSFGPSRNAVPIGSFLNITTPNANSRASVRVIGILSETLLSVILVNPSMMTGTLGTSSSALFLFTVAPGASVQSATYGLKLAFFPYNLQLVNFAQVLDSGIQFLLSFLDLLEAFVALGLIVGIAAIGILALRAVVERRSEVGMIRAMGFRKSQVLAAFLTEYSFLALLGIGIGIIFGLLLSYNLSQSVSGFISFSVPWTNLALVVGLSYGLTLIATGAPSYQASRFPPAEALRYSE